MPGVPSGRACDSCRQIKKKVCMDSTDFLGLNLVVHDTSVMRNNLSVRGAYA